MIGCPVRQPVQEPVRYGLGWLTALVRGTLTWVDSRAPARAAGGRRRGAPARGSGGGSGSGGGRRQGHLLCPASRSAVARSPAGLPQQFAGDDVAHHLRGATADNVDTRVAQMALCLEFPCVAE